MTVGSMVTNSNDDDEDAAWGQESRGWRSSCDGEIDRGIMESTCPWGVVFLQVARCGCEVGQST